MSGVPIRRRLLGQLWLADDGHVEAVPGEGRPCDPLYVRRRNPADREIALGDEVRPTALDPDPQQGAREFGVGVEVEQVGAGQVSLGRLDAICLWSRRRRAGEDIFQHRKRCSHILGLGRHAAEQDRGRTIIDETD